jgi:cation:H+ antiporter
MLGFGADMMIQSATVVAHRLDLSETIIGLTIVAIGTSLPELATSIVAAMRKESDLIAGNIIGSNLFNLLLVGGAASIVSPLNQEPMLIKFEYPVMLLLTGIVWLFYSTDKKVSRSEGIVLVLLYLLVISIIYLYRNGIL